MGIVKRQTFLNSLITYLGYVIGYINVVLLFPLIFETDAFGLRSALLASASVFCQFAGLGINKVIVKYYPYFQNKKGEKNTFLSFSLLVTLGGFIIFGLLFLLLKQPLIGRYGEQLALLFDYLYLVIPLAFFALFNGVLESYLFTLQKTVLSNFLKTAFAKLLWMVEIVLYYFGIIDFEEFWVLFALTYGVNMIILVGYLIYLKEFSLTLKLSFRSRAIKVMSKYGIFSVISGSSQTWVNNIDKLMLVPMMGLDTVGVYTIGFFLGSMVFVPASSITRIISPIISSAIRHKDWDEIADIYKKTSLNLFLLGGIIFNCVWLNADNFYAVLSDEWAGGKYVLLSIALCKLFDMLTGANGLIIILSKYYKFDTYASIGLIALAAGTNYILIPIYGMNGAAYATVITVVVYNSIKLLYVYHKFKMHPFTVNSLKAVVVVSLPLLLLSYVPGMADFLEEGIWRIIVDTGFRCALIGLIIIPLIWIFNISDDINATINETLNKIKSMG